MNSNGKPKKKGFKKSSTIKIELEFDPKLLYNALLSIGMKPDELEILNRKFPKEIKRSIDTLIKANNNDSKAFLHAFALAFYTSPTL